MTIPNYKNQIKAVFFDIDETLYQKETDYLPETVIPALQQLQQAGIIVGIATGRVQASFPAKVSELVKKLNIDTLVCSNGQFVMSKGEIIRNAALPTEKVRQLLDYLIEQEIDYCVLNNDKLCVSNITPKLKGALDPITTHYQVDPHYADHHPVLQILSFHDQTKDHLFKNIPQLEGLKTIRWHEDSVDIFESAGSKAFGIQQVAEHLGFTMENVMAFGDGLNDVEMLSQVGVGVAMGNGCDTVKQLAKHIAPNIDDDGIATFLATAGLIKFEK